MTEQEHEQGEQGHVCARVCPVCLDPLSISNITTLPCDHLLHSNCAVEYFRCSGDNRCPTCRAPPPCVANDFWAKWAKWAAIRNREARRESAVLEARKKFWRARKACAVKKKSVVSQCTQLCKLKREVLLSEEMFDMAVLGSLERRRSRLLSTPNSEIVPPTPLI